MSKWDSMVESKYIKQGDIDGEMVVTIRKFGQVNVAQDGQPEEKKWAVRFDEFSKPMVLNASNIEMLKLIAPSPEEAVGKRCTLYVDHSIMFGGKRVGGLRIKPAPQGGSPALADMEDDIPF